jgi:hypothetical protein
LKSRLQPQGQRSRRPSFSRSLVFVSGEPTQVPLTGPANRQGRIDADNISQHESFDALNIGGGFKTYNLFHPKTDAVIAT